MKKFVISLALASLTGNVMALPVTIDTDDYAIGTNVSQVDSNAWIQAVNWTQSSGFSYSDVIVGDAPTTDWYREQPWDSVAGGFGDHAFARQTTAPEPNTMWNQAHFYNWVTEGYVASTPEINAVGIRFFEPVQYLELRSLASADMAYVWAYDMTGNLIASVRQTPADSTRPGYWYLQDLEITRDQADIAYVVYGGGGTPARLNQITYDVPAPASIALLGIGLAFGGLMRSRRKF